MANIIIYPVGGAGTTDPNIIFDSGMYQGNSRNYSQFRSSANNFWNILITEEY